MDLSDPAERAALVTELGGFLRGRLVIHAPRVLAAAVGEVDSVATHGARGSLVLATVRGAGAVPDTDAARVAWLPPLEFSTVSEELRAEDTRIRSLPDEVVAAVDDFDPDGEALWFGSPFTSDRPVLGREMVGGRPPAWLALEDKILAEEVWATAGVEHAASRVVAVDRAALEEASASLADGAGVVWAGDNREGFHGGGNLVRWVTSATERAAAYDFFARHCDRVRVLPFLDGVPCSIHGCVLEDGTAALRPVEIAMLRRPRIHELVYGGLSSYWDPPPTDREAMRAVVRRVGEHLRERVAYRGFFGIDGVLTADGFRPTELNSRMTAGISTLVSGVRHAEDLFRLVHLRATSGRSVELSAAGLESVVPALDRVRTGRVTGMWEGDVDAEALPPSGEDSFEVAWDGSRLEPGPGDSLSVARTSIGLFAVLRHSRVLAPGQRLAPLNVGLMRLLDERYGTGFGEVVPAPDVRRVPKGRA